MNLEEFCQLLVLEDLIGIRIHFKIEPSELLNDGDLSSVVTCLHKVSSTSFVADHSLRGESGAANVPFMRGDVSIHVPEE